MVFFSPPASPAHNLALYSASWPVFNLPAECNNGVLKVKVAVGGQRVSRVKCKGAEVRNVCLTALHTTLFPRKASQTQRYNDKYGRQLHGFCARHSC